MSDFLDERRLLKGPWQAFERDVARLMMLNRFSSVRVVGGSGDGGADVIGTKEGALWVVQAKFTSRGDPPASAVDEVLEAGRIYKADRLLVACSRLPGKGFRWRREQARRDGVNIELLTPQALLEMTEQSPDYVAERRQLRDYQDEAVTEMHDALRDTGKANVIMATGLGKTVVMGQVVADLWEEGHLPNGRVLLLAHTKDLVNQLHQAFWYQIPKWVPTHQLGDNEWPAHWDGITFATVQSVAANLHRMPEFDLVMVDESHHIGSPTYQEVLDTLQPPMVGGVTATPWRGDGFPLDERLGEPVFQMGIAEGLNRGYLSNVDYRMMADDLDWNFVQSQSRYSYSLKELNRKLIIPIRDKEAAAIIRREYIKGKRTSGLVFSPTIQHASEFAGILRGEGLRAEVMTGKMPARERELMLGRFRQRRLDFLVTVDLFNEGVDVPDVDMIAFMRVTHSRRIFVQQMGRGLRIKPGKKNVLVLDFVSDLRRAAEVIQLDRQVGAGNLEHLGLGREVVNFSREGTGNLVEEWVLDQADLLLRPDDASLKAPRFDYPEPPQPGGIS